MSKKKNNKNGGKTRARGWPFPLWEALRCCGKICSTINVPPKRTLRPLLPRCDSNMCLTLWKVVTPPCLLAFSTKHNLLSYKTVSVSHGLSSFSCILSARKLCGISYRKLYIVDVIYLQLPDKKPWRIICSVCLETRLFLLSLKLTWPAYFY